MHTQKEKKKILGVRVCLDVENLLSRGMSASGNSINCPEPIAEHYCNIPQPVEQQHARWLCVHGGNLFCSYQSATRDWLTIWDENPLSSPVSVLYTKIPWLAGFVTVWLCYYLRTFNTPIRSCSSGSNICLGCAALGRVFYRQLRLPVLLLRSSYHGCLFFL